MLESNICTRCHESPIPKGSRKYCPLCRAIRNRETQAASSVAYKLRQPEPARRRQPLPLLDLLCITCSNTFKGKRGSKRCDGCRLNLS